MNPAPSDPSREQEIWGMALWVETHHGAAGMDYINQKIAQLGEAGEDGDVALWRAVTLRYRALARTGEALS